MRWLRSWWPGPPAGTETAKHVSGTAAPSSSVTSGQPPPCSPNPPPEAPPLHPTTVTTIGQAYYCVFTHYYAAPVLDDRVLLAAAFAGFTQELNWLGMDRPDATLPALTGDRRRDWTAFAAVYQKVTGQLPASPDSAAGTCRSHHDRHDRQPARQPRPLVLPGTAARIGARRPGDHDVTGAPADRYRAARGAAAAVPHRGAAGFPAASHGLRPGDVIVSVNGAPPFAGGIVSEGVMNLLTVPTRSPAGYRCGCSGPPPAAPGR